MSKLNYSYNLHNAYMYTNQPLCPSIILQYNIIPSNQLHYNPLKTSLKQPNRDKPELMNSSYSAYVTLHSKIKIQIESYNFLVPPTPVPQ